MSAGYLSRENKQEGVLICYTIKKKNSNQTNGLNVPAKSPAEKMISGKQVFPKQETKHQLEGRSLTGNQDYSRQNFCSPEGRKKATAKSPDCEKM